MNNFRGFLSLILLIDFLHACIFYGISQPAEKYLYQNPTIAIEDRVQDLLNRLTLEEKLDLLGGTGFATKPIERLGIPELRMADGPLGVRWGPSTAFPAGIAIASSWDPEMAKKVGQCIARELKGKDRHVILGPCVNIARLPQGGRNFESFGEDPYLCSRMVVNYIQGVQQQKVVATIKHYAANNQEYERDFVDVQVSERALHEIYFPSFKAAVMEANVLAVMAAYNKVNGTYCSENHYLLDQMLKTEWGFGGLVMSDWGAVHSVIPTAVSGLDLEMPSGKYLNPPNLLETIREGKVREEQINEKIRRILRVMFTIGLFDNYSPGDARVINSAEHRQVAREAAQAGIVLLKNQDQILPFDLKKIKSIAVIGPNASIARTGGGGSSKVTPINPISPLEGIKSKVGKQIKIYYAPGIRFDGDEKAIESHFLFTDKSMKQNGLQAEYYDNKNLEGEPTFRRIDSTIDFQWHDEAPLNDFPSDDFSVRWSGVIVAPKSGKYVFTSASDDGIRLYINNQLLIDDWNDHAVEARSATITLEEGKIYPLTFEYYEHGGDAIVLLGWQLPGENTEQEAIRLAQKADRVLFFAGTSAHFETEGRDRQNLILPNGQDQLIKRLAAINPNLVVVLVTGSPVLVEEWIDEVKGVLQGWFGGVEMGNALADVIFGDYNPSGKLPITFPRRWEDCSAYATYKKESGVTRYDDDILVGYRHFDHYKISPRFAFGYGLSYTEFSYGDVEISTPQFFPGQKIEIKIPLKNVGSFAGSEVVQLYVREMNASVLRPPKELKKFQKIFLSPGESCIVKFQLNMNDLAYYDPDQKNWNVNPGEFEILIGSSSQDSDMQKVKVNFVQR